jgi:phospholipid/cholesterol/gamma-HCH transport system substrate-binding protein
VSALDRLYAPPEIGAPGKRAGQRRRRDLLLSGLFVLAMALVAAGTLALLIPGLFGGAYRLHAYFPQARGLTPGIQVIQEGYVIGLVEAVEPVFPGRDTDSAHCPPHASGEARAALRPCFRARLRIAGDWPISADSRAQPGSAGLLQGGAILILPGESPVLLGPGDTIAVAEGALDLAAQLAALTDSLQSLVDRTIAPALTSIQRQIETIGNLLGTDAADPADRERLSGIFGNLERLSADLEQVVDPQRLGAILDNVNRMSDDLRRVTASLEGRSEDIRQAVGQYGALAGDIQAVVKENRPALRSSLDDTQFLLQQVATSLMPILTNLEDATRNLAALTRDLRANPGVIIRGREVEPQTPWFR